MKTFKQILSEAYEKRLYRLDAAAPKARAALEKKFGTSSFEELGDMGHIKYDDYPVNPHDPKTNPNEYEEWEMSDAAHEISYGSDTPTEIKRYAGIIDARHRAQWGLEQRDIRIADKLKTSNPSLYRTYISRAKEDVLPAHDEYLNSISKRINWYDSHIKKLEDLNAPQHIIQSAREAQQGARDSFDAAGQTMQTDLHKRIGQLHAETLKSINDPNYR